MVLGGKVNHEIVALVQQAGGARGGPHRQRRRHAPRARGCADGRDLGRVGEVDRAWIPARSRAVADAGFVPVIAPIGVDATGRHPQRERRRGGGRDRARRSAPRS